MIFAYGELLPDSEFDHVVTRLVQQDIEAFFSGPPLESEVVLNALDALGRALDSGALDGLIARYAPPGAREALEGVRPQLSREALEARLKRELANLSGPRPFGRAEVLPLGVLLHIAPGNMPGLPAFTAVEGLLTGNLNLVKLPRGDRGLTHGIFQTLVELEPRLSPWLYAFDLPSSQSGPLKRLACLADGVVTWGGDEAVEAVRKLAPPASRLIEWGHRLSFAYLSGWEELPSRRLSGLAEHIVQTGGLLCSSCQVIYLDTDCLPEAERFCRTLLPALERAAASFHTAPGQAAQAALYAREAFLEQAVERTGSGAQFFPGRGCSLTLREDSALELSRLHGNALVKRLPRGKLVSVLSQHRGRLQTAGLLCPPSEREALSRLLARAGVNRITAPEHMSDPLPGESHDGEHPLRRYVRAVDLEGMGNHEEK